MTPQEYIAIRNPERYSPLFGCAQAYQAWDRLASALEDSDYTGNKAIIEGLLSSVMLAKKTKAGKEGISTRLRADMYNWLADQLKGETTP